MDSLHFDEKRLSQHLPLKPWCLLPATTIPEATGKC